MHITDKEKKAIHEAMKQIRENQKLDEVVGPIAHYASFVKGVSDLPRLGGAAAAAGNAIRNATGNTPIGKLGTAGNFAAKNAGKALGDAAQKFKTSRRDVAKGILNRNQSPQPDVMREEEIEEQQSLPPSAPMSTPDQYDADRSASLRTSQLGMRLANRRVPGLTARGQRTPSKADGSRFNSQTGRFDIQGPKKVPFNLGDRSKTKRPKY